MNVFNKLFNGYQQDNYQKAIKGLKKVKNSFDGFILTFPDVTPNEIMFIKEKWEALPKTIATGVEIMALNFEKNIKTLITTYKPNGYIKPHRHKEEWEIGKILKGRLIDKLNGIEYIEGDTYKINPNQYHYFLSPNEGCVVYSILSTEEISDLKPLTQKIKNKINLN